MAQGKQASRARKRRRRRAERPASSPASSAAWRESVADAASRPARPARRAPRPERPRPPWHPLPLAEILIVAGAVGFFVGVRHPGPALAAGVLALALGTAEFTLREHLGGYRSHATLLALLPMVIVHTAAVLVLSAFTHVGRSVNLVLLAIDLVGFAVLWRLLRGRYHEARAEHAVRGRA